MEYVKINPIYMKRQCCVSKMISEQDNLSDKLIILPHTRATNYKQKFTRDYNYIVTKFLQFMPFSRTGFDILKDFVHDLMFVCVCRYIESKYITI